MSSGQECITRQVFYLSLNIRLFHIRYVRRVLVPSIGNYPTWSFRNIQRHGKKQTGRAITTRKGIPLLPTNKGNKMSSSELFQIVMFRRV